MHTFAEVQAASSAAYRTLGDLEWEVESTTVTPSSADWWDLLLKKVRNPCVHGLN